MKTVEKNKVVGVTTWSEIFRLSRRMANGLGERLEDGLMHSYPRLDLVYIADDSFGGRTWKTTNNPIDMKPSFNGNYLGWNEEQSNFFSFTSASSGARITATRQKNHVWQVEFEGTDSTDRESDYARVFLSLDWVELNAQLPQRELFVKAVCR